MSPTLGIFNSVSFFVECKHGRKTCLRVHIDQKLYVQVHGGKKLWSAIDQSAIEAKVQLWFYQENWPLTIKINILGLVIWFLFTLEASCVPSFFTGFTVWVRSNISFFPYLRFVENSHD